MPSKDGNAAGHKIDLLYIVISFAFNYNGIIAVMMEEMLEDAFEGK